MTEDFKACLTCNGMGSLGWLYDGDVCPSCGGTGLGATAVEAEAQRIKSQQAGIAPSPPSKESE